MVLFFFAFVVWQLVWVSSDESDPTGNSVLEAHVAMVRNLLHGVSQRVSVTGAHGHPTPSVASTWPKWQRPKEFQTPLVVDWRKIDALQLDVSCA